MLFGILLLTCWWGGSWTIRCNETTSSSVKLTGHEPPPVLVISVNLISMYLIILGVGRTFSFLKMRKPSPKAKSLYKFTASGNAASTAVEMFLCGPSYLLPAHSQASRDSALALELTGSTVYCDIMITYPGHQEEICELEFSLTAVAHWACRVHCASVQLSPTAVLVHRGLWKSWTLGTLLRIPGNLKYQSFLWNLTISCQVLEMLKVKELMV